MRFKKDREVYVFIFCTSVKNKGYLLVTPCSNDLDYMVYYEQIVKYSLSDNLILGSAFLTYDEVSKINKTLEKNEAAEAIAHILAVSKIVKSV